MRFACRVSSGLIGAVLAGATLLAALPARAQGMMRLLEEIGGSPAAAKAFEALAENSTLLATALKELGIRAAPDASALARLGAEQRGAAIVRSDILARLFVTTPAGDLLAAERRLAAIDTLRRAAPAPQPLLSLDVGTGDAALRTPLYLVRPNGVLTLTMQRFNVYKPAGPVLGGIGGGAATACWANTCLDKLAAKLWHSPGVLNPPRISLGELPRLQPILVVPTPPAVAAQIAHMP